jgi:hypothetical protein
VDPAPPRATRRRRLPGRPSRGPDPARGAHPRGRRRLRGHDRDELLRHRGTQFGPEVVDAFLGVLAAEGGAER